MKQCAWMIVLVLPSIAWGQSAEEKKATVAYLQSLQTNIGGFLSMQPQPNIRLAPTLRATSAGIRALKYWGGTVPNLDGAKKYVLGCYDAESGGFGERPGAMPEIFVTATGLMAAAELKLPLEEYRKKSVAFFAREVMEFEEMRIAVAGIEALGEPAPLIGEATQAKWRKLLPKINQGKVFIKESRILGGTVVAMYRLGDKYGSPDLIEAVLASLQADQRADGGFGAPDMKASDMETTYRVMRCFARLKGQPKDMEKVKSFVAKCRNADGGYAPVPGETSNVGATYYAGIILHWLDQMKSN